MAFTYRNAVQRALTYAELDGNLQTVEDLHDETVTARDAAVLNAGIYVSTAAGLAATTNGEYFSVPSAESEGYLELYKNNAGSAVLTKTYYSRPQGAMEEIGSYSALDAYSGSASVFYIRGMASLFDGAHGVFRRDDTDTTTSASGICRVDAAGRRWKREFSGLASVLWFGADLSGTADSTTAVQATIDSGHHAYAPEGTYKITAPLVLGDSESLSGDGFRTVLNAVSVTGAVVKLGTGSRSSVVTHCRLSRVRIQGTATEGVRVQGAVTASVESVSLQGLTATRGFVFDYTWGSSFKDLWTNGATISESCYVCGQDYNANAGTNWYASNFCTQNVLIDATFESGSGVSHGSVWNMITAQGGNIGLYVRTYQVGAVNGLYTENVRLALSVGDLTNTKLVRGFSFNGIELAGPSSSHSDYANRKGVLNLSYCVGVTINGVDFSGAFNCATWATVSFSGGGGSGAYAVARVTAAGAVHSVAVINGGSGYTSAPTVTIGGAGSSATATSAIGSGKVTSVTVTAGGSGYVPTDRCPVAITYSKCYKVAISGIYLNSGLALTSPLFPHLTRNSDATSDAGVTIIDDLSWANSNNGNSAELRKTQGYAYQHALIEADSSGARAVTLYVPPQYP